MIDWVTIQGYRSIKDIQDLKLGQINALIGANGSGKSNFIRAFELLQAISCLSLQQHIVLAGGAERILHFGAKVTKRVVIEISFSCPNHKDANVAGQLMGRYKIELMSGEGDTLYVCNEQMFSSDQTETGLCPEQQVYSENRVSRESELFAMPADTRPAAASWLQDYLNRWRFYHFCDTGPSSPLRRTSQVNDNRELHPDGSNLAAFLYLLGAKHESSYHLIRSAVHLVAPFFKDFALEPEKLNTETIRFWWKDEKRKTDLPDSALSDGSLRFIALATLLLQPKEFLPPVILLDEPELGLHPYAITVLVSLIKLAAVESQIVFATQSPSLLDHQRPEDVLVAERMQGGTLIVRCEEDKERLLPWLEDYSLGQLWDKNEIGGRPVPENMAGGLPR